MPISRGFDAIHGMQTDPPLDQMPKNVVRRIIDFLPEFQFLTIARGAWTYLTGALAHVGSDTYSWMTYCPFGGGSKLVMSSPSSNGITWVNDLSAAATGTVLSTAFLSGPFTPPIFHRTPAGGLLIAPWAGTGNRPRKYDGSAAPADLGGTPPVARLAASWGDYLLLANGNAPNQNRIWFSAVGNPESWDTAANGGWLDVPGAIQAVVPKGNTIFVFTDQAVHLIVGDDPPFTNHLGNLTQRKFAFTEGIGKGISGTGAEAVVTYKDFVIWANANGVWKSDGGQPIDLTKQGGIKSYWPFVYRPQAGYRVAVGTYRSYLFVTVVQGASWTSWRTLIYDLENNTWWEWSNVPGTHLTHIPPDFNVREDLLVIDRPNNKVGSIAYAFNAYAAAGDDNLTTKQPTIVTGAYRFGTLGQKRIRRGFITSKVENGASLQVGFITPPDQFVQAGSDPTSVPGQVTTLTISGSPTNASKNLRTPLRIDRRCELIQAYLVGFGCVGVAGLDFEATPYDPVRDGDART